MKPTCPHDLDSICAGALLSRVFLCPCCVSEYNRNFWPSHNHDATQHYQIKSLSILLDSWILLHHTGTIFCTKPSAAQAVACIVGIIVSGRTLLRPLYRRIADLHNEAIFAATTLLVVLGTSVITQLFGLSLALGAFLVCLCW